ncbi:MAG TPA: hypothetical protein VMR98_05935 [Candidatus Polarisedimenticolaceae bacterium]|nr:hypothetical protein [Candidatus Polarisedimenticolaceae bacterium]
MFKQQIDALMSKNMDRREFFSYVGAAMIAVVGLSSIIKALTGSNSPSDAKDSYGGGAYGGSNRKLGKISRKLG